MTTNPLLVFDNPYAVGFHGYGNKKQDWLEELQNLVRYRYIPSPECWETSYSTDAHCVSYAWKAPFKLTKAGAACLLRNQIPVQWNWVIIDLDLTGHGSWESSAQFSQAMDTLKSRSTAPELLTAGLYQTVHGCRLVWPLACPLEITRAESYLHQFFQYLAQTTPFAEVGLELDTRCRDWTRLMRMPRVMRGDTGMRQELCRDFKSMQPLTWLPGATSLEQLYPLGQADKGNLDTLIRPGEEVWAILKDLPEFERLYMAQPLTSPGSRNDTLFTVVGKVAFRLDTINPEDLYQVIAPSVLADTTPGAPTLAQLKSMCYRACSKKAGMRAEPVGAYSSFSLLEDVLPSEDTEEELDEILNSPLPADYGPEYQKPPTLLDVSTLPVLEITGEISAEEYDGSAFATANAIKESLRLKVRQAGHKDEKWINRLESTPDKSNSAGSLVSRGGLRPSLTNLILILQYDPEWKEQLYWDALENDVRYSKIHAWPREVLNGTPSGRSRRWSEEDITRLQTWFRWTTYKLDGLKDAEVLKAVLAVAKTRVRHPVKEYLEKLEWDGTPRLDRMLVDFFHVADTPLIRQLSAKWMISAVARAFEPGCKVDTVLVFDGKQGKHKSESMKALVPDATWVFDSDIPLGDKDAYQVLQGVWIAELPELDKHSPKELKKWKRFITSAVDRYRPSYARKPEAFPRQFVLYASTNDQKFLTDDQNRRYWTCSPQKKIDVAGLKVHRDALWAEAVHRYKQGEIWYLSEDMEQVLAKHQETKRTEIPYEAFIQDALTNWPDMRSLEFISTTEIILKILKAEPADLRRYTECVESVMYALGWTEDRLPRTQDPTQRRVWFRPKTHN